MDCKTVRRLLEAEVDGELDLMRHLEVEAHVEGCAQCARVRENLRERKRALQVNLPRFAAPAELAGKIRTAISWEIQAVPGWSATSGRAGQPAAQFRRSVPPFWRPSWQFALLAASIALALTAGYRWGQSRTRGSMLIDEAVSEHIRSLQVNHLSDVVSTDQHTVRPWFAGKLDFAPPVPDLTAIGFPLAGGRLEHIAGRPAAALVYRRRQHALNLFIWQSGAEPLGLRNDLLSGYHTEAWSQNGFNYLAVSEIAADELKTFTAAFRQAVR